MQPASRSRRATWPPPVATSSAVTPGPGSAHSTSRSRSGPSRCASLVRYCSARSSQWLIARQLHRAPGAVEHRRLGMDVRPRRLGEQAPALLGVRAVEPDDERVARSCPSRRAPARIPRATSSQRVIPPKMLKKIERTCSSRVITSSASTTPCALPPPPRSQKFAGPPADVGDDVHGRHREPGAVAEDADVAVELHVGDALLAREGLERVGRGGVAHRGDVGVLVERVVVDGELRVERLHLAARASRSAG